LTARPDRCRPRIALGIEVAEPGGAENMVVQLGEALRDSGLDPVIASMESGWMTERAAQLGLPVRVFPQQRGLDPAWVPRFALWLRRERIALFHSHEFAMNVYGGAAARLVGIPTLATIHGRHWAGEARRRVIAYRVLHRLGMRIVVVAHDLGRFLAERMAIPRDWFEVVHNGIPLPEPIPPADRSQRRRAARAALGLPGDGALLIAVGSLFPVKDHDNLLRAFAGLAGARLAIAGEGGEESRLRRLAAELGVGPRVHFLGLRDDVERVLLASDVFVLTSRSEALPLAVLEAMAMGLPVVSTRVGGVPEVVTDGETGVLVPPANPAALAEALRGLLAAPERAASLARAAEARVRAEFSIAHMVERYLTLYAELSRGRIEAPRGRRGSPRGNGGT
jgi:glycosyltransferase involved in cell wall biosynthesis